MLVITGLLSRTLTDRQRRIDDTIPAFMRVPKHKRFCLAFEAGYWPAMILCSFVDPIQLLHLNPMTVTFPMLGCLTATMITMLHNAVSCWQCPNASFGTKPQTVNHASCNAYTSQRARSNPKHAALVSGKQTPSSTTKCHTLSRQQRRTNHHPMVHLITNQHPRLRQPIHVCR